ncbi:hypothetical protein JZ751_000930 [Albula glossodonta]|uniref:C-type lectin domain-containing protein n=1 Tax=Albula glossodonta TaxID=121402 RepID=A0A8T2PY22_9TELE|nr:hypothetical protein JZ751_000930 [Albula glossodonta]
MATFTMISFLCAAGLSCITLGTSAKLPFCQGTCPSGWYSNNGRCFKYVATKTNWADAERTCQNMGGNLPSVHSEAEHNFLKTLFKGISGGEDAFWLGLSDCHQEGWWFWSDGSKVDYLKWNTGEPNNLGDEDCLHTSFGSQKGWNDIPCKNSYAFICSKVDSGLA